MLQAGGPRAIQPRRPTTGNVESAILGAKHDSRRRISRAKSPPVGRVSAPRQASHRRHLSVPDNILMSIAATPTSNVAEQNFNGIYQAKQLKVFGESNLSQHPETQVRLVGDDANIFLQQQQRSRTPAVQPMSKFAPVTPQSPFQEIVQDQQDASELIDELLAFEASPSTTPSRQDPAVMLAPAPAKYEPETPQFYQRNGHCLPSPPQTAQVPSMSAFDLAPLPHPNFVSLAALSIPIDTEVADTHSSLSSPTFASSEAQQFTESVFSNPMPTVLEEDSQQTEHKMIKVPSLPDFDFSSLKGRGSPEPRPLGTKFTGITPEEIASYISGPEPNDGKWLCLYPECSKRFGRKENIKSHVQTHLGDRQYSCPHCQKCFVRQHDLKRHSKTHSGHKPYQCRCGNAFARHDALTRHRQRGMCIGAFEGIVKKVVKRGRPRKRPLEDGEEPKPRKKKDKKTESVASDTASSSEASGWDFSSSSSSSDTSDVSRTPRLYEFSSPIPESPTNVSYGSLSPLQNGSGSSDLLPHCLDSPDITPPTSPPEFYDASAEFTDFEYRDLLESADSVVKKEPYAGSSGGDTSGPDEFFDVDEHDPFGLTQLERDPSILADAVGLGKTKALAL